MSDHLEDVFSSLRTAFGGRRPTAADAEKRGKLERRLAANPEDGRRKRATGRTKAFNCKMKPDLHKRIVQASRKHGRSITAMCEQAFVDFLTKLEG